MLTEIHRLTNFQASFGMGDWYKCHLEETDAKDKKNAEHKLMGRR